MFPILGSVSLALVNIVFATLALTLGFVAGWWAFRSRMEGHDDASDGSGGTSTSDHALMAIGQVHDVTTRVAREVDSHSSEVQKMSAELALLEGGGAPPSGDSAVGIIAKVLRANARLQAQLALAEEKLEAQAAEIASHQHAARTDPLTGLANRRALDLEIARRFAEWQRKGTSFSVLLLDVDCFKSINDTFGHQAGDEVLRHVGRSFSETTREMDLPCRYGGDEFVVIMPATQLDFAAGAAERIRKTIESLRTQRGQQPLKVTVSYGVAEVTRGDDAKSVLRRADDALYQAKRSGRDRGFLHDGSECHPVASDRQPATAASPAAPAPEVRLLFTLPRRQRLEQELKRRVGESQRYGLPLSVMFVQVTDVARIAAQHGERTMHLVLDVVAHRLQDTIREMDFLAREEDGRFAILLPGSTTAEANQVARRIETTQGCQTVTIHDAKISVSLALGLATYEPGDDAASLRSRTEKVLANKQSEIGARTMSLVT